MKIFESLDISYNLYLMNLLIARYFINIPLTLYLDILPISSEYHFSK